MHIPVFLLLLLSFLSASGQDSLETNYTDLNKVAIETKINRTASFTYFDNWEVFAKNYNNLPFKTGLRTTGSVPVNLVNKNIALRFRVCNNADTTVSVYFCPGFYYSQINLYKATGNTLSPLPSILPTINDSIGYRKITLGAHDSTTIVATLGMIRTYNNGLRPRLIGEQFLPAFIAELHHSYRQTDTITYLFCGLLLMMVLFSLANFFQGANRDFLYYSAYGLLLGGMLFMQTIFHLRANHFAYFLESFLDFVLQSIGIIFYMLFMQRFLNTKENHPFLHKLYKAGIGMLILSIVSYTICHKWISNYKAEFLIENATKILLLLMILVFLIYSIRFWSDRLLRFLFWGNFFLFSFSLISQIAVLFNPLFKTLPGVLSSSVLYYETGLLLELVFFLTGLNFKNRRQLIEQTRERETLKAQNKLKEYEMELAVYKAQQEERERISADMHDELGSGMTAIRLMSEIARNKMKENTPVEIHKISSSADDVLNKMNAIIWSMHSGNDSVDNLVSYIRAYALEYFESTPVTCEVHTPENIPHKDLAGEKRRNVFLSVKESLNNVLKHAHATQVIVTIHVDRQLKIMIKDNGKGIDMQQLRRFGNGLKNITRRMESIGGNFSIVSDNGTLTTLQLPL